ncbi:hypothetical protein ACC685_36695, partial [Rhizobium ruizarguesonis]
ADDNRLGPPRDPFEDGAQGSRFFRDGYGGIIGLAAILIGLALFSLFILAVGKSPATLFQLMYTGGFGSWFSVQNSLSRAAPLLLKALCVALP